MKVRRSVEGGADAAPSHAPAAAASDAALATPAVLLTSDAGLSPAEESVDEALVYVTSPKVGGPGAAKAVPRTQLQLQNGLL